MLPTRKAAKVVFDAAEFEAQLGALQAFQRHAAEPVANERADGVLTWRMKICNR